MAKQRATTEHELAKSAGEAGSPWFRAGGTNSTAVTADAKLADEARPLGIAKKSAMTKSELAKSSGGAGPSWSRAFVRERLQQIWDVPQVRELMVKEVRMHGSLDSLCQHVHEAWLFG